MLSMTHMNQASVPRLYTTFLRLLLPTPSPSGVCIVPYRASSLSLRAFDLLLAQPRTSFPQLSAWLAPTCHSNFCLNIIQLRDSQDHYHLSPLPPG